MGQHTPGPRLGTAATAAVGRIRATTACWIESPRCRAVPLFLFFMNTARQHHLDVRKACLPSVDQQRRRPSPFTLHPALSFSKTTVDRGIGGSWRPDRIDFAGYNWYTSSNWNTLFRGFASCTTTMAEARRIPIYLEARARISNWDLKAWARWRHAVGQAAGCNWLN